MELEFLYTINNVNYLTEKETDFSSVYTSIRQKEERILTDQEVLQLPKILTTNVHAKEWQLRKKSTERFTDYIKTKNEALTILNIGCGNGWFTNKIASVNNKNNVIGIDINSIELEQAARLFKSENTQFIYGDLFNTNVFNNQCNIITLNACIQYFPNFETLFKKLRTFLKPNGEIHILDSPFYKSKDITEAKKRSITYYTNLGFPEMASNYFHHKKEDTKTFEVLYKNKNRILRKILNIKDSPFPWLRYVNK